VSRIEVWAVEESRVERMTVTPRAWALFLWLGVAWTLFGILILSFHVETLTALAVFSGAIFIAGGVSAVLNAWKLDGGHRRLLGVLGVLAVATGIVLLVWPHPTLYVVAVLVGWYLVVMGIVHFVQALFHTADRYWWAGLLLGLVELLIGSWAATYPGKSLSVFAALIGIYAVLHGIIEMFGAFAMRGLDRDLRVSAREGSLGMTRRPG
jgi:uncharacterized membrane protein HdeD (DUF308 family)